MSGIEPAESPLRLRLILGKFQVKRVSKGLVGLKAVIDFTNSVEMTIDVPIDADLRLGDWLTFYTECGYAQPSQPSIQ